MAAKHTLFVSIEGRCILSRDLPDGDYTLGRQPGNDIALPAPGIAARHAQLELRDGKATLRHLAPGFVTALEGWPLPDFEQYQLGAVASWTIEPFSCVLVARRNGLDAAGPPVTLRGVERWPTLGSLPVAPEPAPLGTRPDERELLEAALERTPAGRYLYDLPDLYHDERSFLAGYLKIFEAIWEPLEQRQDNIALYFDPRTCPAAMLGWLASWVGFPLEPPLPERRLRAVLSEALWLLRWRGTGYGLTRLLELATGAPVALDVVREGGGPVLLLRCGRLSDPQLTQEVLGALVERHKPAHCGYRLELMP